MRLQVGRGAQMADRRVEAVAKPDADRLGGLRRDRQRVGPGDFGGGFVRPLRDLAGIAAKRIEVEHGLREPSIRATPEQGQAPAIAGRRIGVRLRRDIGLALGLAGRFLDEEGADAGIVLGLDQGRRQDRAAGTEREAGGGHRNETPAPRRLARGRGSDGMRLAECRDNSLPAAGGSLLEPITDTQHAPLQTTLVSPSAARFV
ncbi:hypothetical protein [Bosea sp. TAB14]|uniref:hypothetical protein n=1 Tax=Bosea sp. TAB14 TaxID=3237481 RepID=UPI003F91E026